MKNEYDALNRATVCPEEYAPVPLGEAQQAAQLRRLLAAAPAQAGGPAPAAPAQAGGGTAPEAGTPRRRARGGKRMAALLLAAALACGVLAAGAAGAFAWGADFAAFLGFEQQELPLLGELSQGLGLTQTVEDASITLEGVLGDSHCVYIPFTVTAPPGTQLQSAQEYNFDVASFQTDAPDATAVTLQALPGGQAAENQLRFVLMASVSTPLSGRTAQIELWNMYHNSAPGAGERLHDGDAVVPGHFSFAFRLEYEPAGVSLLEGPAQAGLEAPLETLELSPISVYLKLAEPAADSGRAALMDVPVALCFADGTRLPIVSRWDIQQGAAGVPGRRFQAQDSLIIQLLQAQDMEQITAVEVNGTAFPLE